MSRQSFRSYDQPPKIQQHEAATNQSTNQDPELAKEKEKEQQEKQKEAENQRRVLMNAVSKNWRYCELIFWGILSVVMLVVECVVFFRVTGDSKIYFLFLFSSQLSFFSEKKKKTKN